MRPNKFWESGGAEFNEPPATDAEILALVRGTTIICSHATNINPGREYGYVQLLTLADGRTVEFCRACNLAWLGLVDQEPRVPVVLCPRCHEDHLADSPRETIHCSCGNTFRASDGL